MSALQRLAFDGSLHEIEPLVKAATAEGRSNPFLGVPNVLVYAVLSRSFETVSFLLQNGFGTPEELRRGETWTGFTALHVALFIGHRDIVSLLWNNYNANVNARDLFFGSALDYCHALGLVTNAEVYFAGMQNRGFGFGYKTFDTLVQLTMRGAYEWNHPQKEIFELRNVKNSDVAFVNYWNMKSKEMERMPLAEWSDLVRCVYQPFVSAKDAWLDELMFNGVYVADPTPELRLRFAPHLTNRQVYKTPETVVMSYLNARVGFGCFAAKDLKQGDFVVNYTGELHTDRYKWKDVEKTTAFRLNFMKQIHDLGEKGKGVDLLLHVVSFLNSPFSPVQGLIKKQSLPQYLRDPNFNIAIPGTSYFLNSSECGSMGRVINHSSSHWNCEIVIVWNAGVPQALVVTTKDVAKGEQLFLNYGEMWKYFQQKREEKEKGKKSILNFDESEMFQVRWVLCPFFFFHPL